MSYHNNEIACVGLVDCIAPPEVKLPRVTILPNGIRLDYPDRAQRLQMPVEVKGGPLTSEAVAVWDTGSVETVISERLAQTLQLPVVGERYMVVPGGEVTRKNVHSIQLKLSEALCFHVLAIAMPLRAHDCDVLIGMEVIAKAS